MCGINCPGGDPGLSRPVLMPCECCGSEGRILTSNGGPDETDHGPCVVCEATGRALIPSLPVEPDDEYFNTEESSNAAD